MSAPILELKAIDLFYGPIQALKQVSLPINEGETLGLGWLDSSNSLGKEATA